MDNKPGFCAIGIYHTKAAINVGTLIRSAVAFGANFVFTIGRRYEKQNSAVKTDRHIPIFHYPDFDDFKHHLPKNARLVCVEISEKAVSICTFKHPKQAVYLLGAEDHGLPPQIMNGFQVVELPGQYCLNVASAGTIVLYDRFLKMGT